MGQNLDLHSIWPWNSRYVPFSVFWKEDRRKFGWPPRSRGTAARFARCRTPLTILDIISENFQSLVQFCLATCIHENHEFCEPSAFHWTVCVYGSMRLRTTSKLVYSMNPNSICGPQTRLAILLTFFCGKNPDRARSGNKKVHHKIKFPFHKATSSTECFSWTIFFNWGAGSICTLRPPTDWFFDNIKN